VDKEIKEEDLKDLEQEIDSAVDRLFVPKNPELIESLTPKSPSPEPVFEAEVQPAATVRAPFEMAETSILELSSEMEKSFDAIPASEEEEPLRPVEDWMTTPSTPAPSTPPRSTPARSTPASSILSAAPEPEARSSLERLEGQLLTLEWEINKENLQKTRQEVRLLKQRGEGGLQGASVLAFMEKVLSRMISHGDTISPALIKFLMDSKETLKLLIEKDGGGEIEALKRLASEGIEAKFTCLQLSSETPLTAPPSPSAEEMLREEPAGPEGRAVDEIMGRVTAYFTKMEAGLKKVNDHLALLDERVRHASPSPEMKRTAPEPVGAAGMSLTLVRVNERFFGVPSDRAVKLFKIPSSLSRQVMRQPSIRLKGMEVRITDLRRIFSLPGNSLGKEQRLLIVQNDGTYNGLVVEQVLPGISASAVERRTAPYSWGTFHWAYRGHPMSVPILDLNQL
jgi:hypothetical protein